MAAAGEQKPFLHNNRPSYYFETCVDEPIDGADADQRLGYTKDEWESLRRNGELSEAIVDDEHNQTPVGAIVSTHLTRSEDGQKEMLGAGAVIYLDTERGRQLASEVKSGKLKTTSIDYRTRVDRLMGRKTGQKLIGLGLHPRPKNASCTIYRRQGSNDGDVVSLSGHITKGGPGGNAAQQSANLDSTNTKDREDPKQSVMASTNNPVPAVAEKPAASTEAVKQPAVAPPTPATNAPADGQPKNERIQITDAERQEAEARLARVRGLAPADQLAKAAHADELEARLRKVTEENARLQALHQKRVEAETAARWEDLKRLKEQLTALDFDYEKDAEAKKELDAWAKDPDAASVALRRTLKRAEEGAKTAKQKQEEATRAAEHKAKAEAETALIEAYYRNKLPMQDIDRAKVLLARNAANTTGMEGVTQTSTPATQAAPATQSVVPPVANKTLNAEQEAALRSQAVSTDSNELRQRIVDELSMNMIRQMAQAQGSAPNRYNRSTQSREGDSLGSQMLSAILNGMTSNVIEVKQGADGAYGTGQLIGGVTAGTPPLSQLWSAVQKPQTTKDIAARAVLAIQKGADGKHYFTNPISKVQFCVEKDICYEDERREHGQPPQRFGPDVMLATVADIYAQGAAYALPPSSWSNGGVEGGRHKVSALGYGNLIPSELGKRR